MVASILPNAANFDIRARGAERLGALRSANAGSSSSGTRCSDFRAGLGCQGRSARAGQGLRVDAVQRTWCGAVDGA